MGHQLWIWITVLAVEAVEADLSHPSFIGNDHPTMMIMTTLNEKVITFWILVICVDYTA